MLAIGLGYVPLLVAAVRLPDGSLAGLGWLRVGLSLLSVEELLAGALGPSFVLRLTPLTSGGRWLGAWCGATAVGFWLAGQLGGLWEAASYDGDMSAALQRGIWTGSRRNMTVI